MTAVIVVATAYPLPGRNTDVRAALLRAVPVVHGEDGCELYALHEKDDRLVLVEKWTSQQALDVHATAPALAQLRRELDPITSAELEIHVLAPLLAGETAKGVL